MGLVRVGLESGLESGLECLGLGLGLGIGIGLGLGLGLGAHQLHGALEDVREGDVREVHVALIRYFRHTHA